MIDTSVVDMRRAYEFAHKRDLPALIRYLLGIARECNFRRCPENEWAYRDAEEAKSSRKVSGEASRFRRFLAAIQLSPDCLHEIVRGVEQADPKSAGLLASWPTKDDLSALVFYCGFTKPLK